MRTLTILVLCLIVPPFAALAATTPALTELLQKGLLEEEANQNLTAAIQAYQAAVNQFSEDRKVAGTAAFRLGECYLKLGKTNEAFAQFQRVARDFDDQPRLVQLSNKHLADAGRVPDANQAFTSPSRTRPVSAEEAKLTQEEIDLVKQQLAAAESAREHGRASSEEVVRLKRDQLQLERLLPGNAEPARQSALIGQEIQYVQQLLDESKKRIAVGAASPADEIPLKRDLLRLQRELAALNAPESKSPGFTTRLNSIVRRADNGDSNPATGQSEQARVQAPTDEETKEIQRIQEIIKNSPDLINAVTSFQLGTPLQQAASKGQLLVARFLLENGAEVDAKKRGNSTTPDGRTALHLAAESGHKAMAELLLAHKANVNAASELGNTPLHLASGKGYLAVAQVLLTHGAIIEAKNTQGETPLHSAVEARRRPMVDLLLEHKADINAQDASGETPLMVAVTRREGGIVDLLLANHASVNLRTNPGPIGNRTALTISVQQRSFDITRALLEHGADPNVNTAMAEENGLTIVQTPLINATRSEDLPTVELLLSRGADVNARDANQRTALHSAVARQSLPLTRLLLSKGAGVNLTEVEGATPLLVNLQSSRSHRGNSELNASIPPGNPAYPQQSGRRRQTLTEVQTQILKVLLEKGADVNLTNSPPLIWAINLGDTNLLNLLLSNKADPNLTSMFNSTPLLEAAGAGDIEMTQGLLAAGADVNKKGIHGNAPLHVAAARTDTNLIQILLENKADPNSQDDGGYTPLHYAAFQGSKAAVKVLVAAGARLDIQANNGATPVDASGSQVMASGPNIFSSIPNLIRAGTTGSRPVGGIARGLNEQQIQLNTYLRQSTSQEEKK